MLKKSILWVLSIALIASMAGSVYAQDSFVSYSLVDLTKWQLTNRQVQVVKYKGQSALNLKGAPGSGYALLKDVEFINGIIELDIAAIPRFTGILFRADGSGAYEGIYFRPQNSKHKDPVKRKYVVQYHAPPKFSWSFLRKNFPEKYEAPAQIPMEEWFHVKVVVKNRTAKVFINNAPTPCLQVDDLKSGIGKGAIGVWSGNGSPATFANLKIKKLPGKAAVAPQQKTVKVDPAILKKYSGKYEINPQFAVTITCVSDRLYTQATGQPRFEIFPKSETEFFLKVVDARIKFQQDKAGVVTGLIIFQNGREINGKKVN